MENHLINLDLISNPKVFEDIHDLKQQFKGLLTDMANSFDAEYLSSLYSHSKGTKISMGNELNKCPYQVLDIFRNFDKNQGHNIRILNWWGHGLFVFVFFGKDIAKENIIHAREILSEDFTLAKGSSPWDYLGMITNDNSPPSTETIDWHLKKFGYLQWFKKVTLHSDVSKLKNELLNTVDQIFRFHTF